MKIKVRIRFLYFVSAAAELKVNSFAIAEVSLQKEPNNAIVQQTEEMTQIESDILPEAGKLIKKETMESGKVG